MTSSLTYSIFSCNSSGRVLSGTVAVVSLDSLVLFVVGFDAKMGNCGCKKICCSDVKLSLYRIHVTDHTRIS